MGLHRFKYSLLAPTIVAGFIGCTPTKGTEDTGDARADLPVIECTDTETVVGDIDWRADTPSPCDGLQGIVIDGTIDVEEEATDLDGLYCVCGITGDFWMMGAYQVETLQGLLNLEFVQGRFSIAIDPHYPFMPIPLENESLTDISAMSRLRSVGGTFWIGGSSSYSRGTGEYEYSSDGNPSLTQVNGFSSLETIGGGFQYWGNVSVLEGSSFPALQSIGTHASFRVASFEDGPYFESLESIGGELSIIASNQYEMGHFPVLTEVGGLIIQGTPEAFTTLGDFSQLERINGDLTVTSDRHLVADYENNNLGLQDLDDLSGLEQIAGNVTITDNELLCEIQAHALVEAVSEAQIGGTITIENNRTDCD